MSNPKRAIPAQRILKEAFDYDATSGICTWNWRPREHFSSKRGWLSTNAQKSGKRVGNATARGYIAAEIMGTSFMIHRLIWKWQTGADPTGEIDHFDRDPSNNEWLNLRDVTHVQNSHNRSTPKNNTTGRIGVQTVDTKQGTKFTANIFHHGECMHLGTFTTFEGAAEARTAMEIKLGRHYQ